MTAKRLSQRLAMGGALFLLAALAQPAGAGVTEGPVSAQKIPFGNGGGGATGIENVGDFQIVHMDGFKHAEKRIAISVFNVAFPHEKTQSAATQTKSGNNAPSWSILSQLNMGEKKSAYQHTTIDGVDQATEQRIADSAYADFVAQLTKAGYDVISASDLATLTPEYTTWTAQPNFSEGRYGTYVAPTGRNLYFLRSDTAKADSQGNLSRNAAAFQGFDSPQAFKRSPYLAYNGKIGVIAVTLVVDYGTYVNTGDTKKFNAKMEVSFTPGVTAQSGSFYDTATLLEYWGPNSGGFPAVAALAAPLTSDLPFATIGDNSATDGDSEPTVHADPAAFEKAAGEVTQAANAKMVEAFSNAAAQ